MYFENVKQYIEHLIQMYHDSDDDVSYLHIAQGVIKGISILFGDTAILTPYEADYLYTVNLEIIGYLTIDAITKARKDTNNE